MEATEEARLADGLLARDEGALREVIDAFGPLVYGMARRVVADPQLAEEVAQDAFLALWRRPGAFDPERGSLGAFLVAIARNKAIDLVRREQAARRARDSLAAEAEASAGGPSVEPLTEADERHEVAGALAQLSRVQREAIVLAYFGGRSYREVATELGIPEGTAKTRLRDGLVRLRELMASHRGT
jgi:RNA polymerase sigma-70 factor (ECF subfamily)